MLHYIRKRLLTVIPVFFGITLCVFLFLHLGPGTIADLMGDGSSFNDTDRAALEAHSLGTYFEQVIYAQELGEDKRSPAIFKHVAKLLGVSPKECVLFDDSLSACKAAKAAGMTVVGVYDPFYAHYEDEMRSFCHRYIKAFTELL